MASRGLLACLAAAFVLALCAAPAGAAGPSDIDDGSWEFRVTPYIWTASIDGLATVGEVDAPVEVGFSDLLDILSFAGLVHAEVDRGRWGAVVDVAYFSTSEEDRPLGPGGPVGTSADIETALLMFDVLGTYQMEMSETDALQFLAGIRVTQFDADVGITIGPADLGRSTDSSWVDPLVGLRMHSRFADDWYAWARSDVGGFGVSSELIWDVIGGVGYEINSLVDLSLGYRFMGVEWEGDDSDSVDARLNLVEHGLLFGVTFSF